MTTRRAVVTGLKKRCPCCKKLRGYREPPGDQGGEHHRRPPWYLTPFGWACGYCAQRYGDLRRNEFIENGKIWPEEDSQWKLKGDDRLCQVRCYRYGLVVLFEVARQDNAGEAMVNWQSPLQRKEWIPA